MVECILLVSSILFCTASVYRSRIGIRKAIQQRMLDIANCAAGSINGEILKTIDKDAVGNTDYNHIYDTLAVFRDNIELEYIYSIKEEGDDNFIFTMDLDPETPAAYGDIQKLFPAPVTAWPPWMRFPTQTSGANFTVPIVPSLIPQVKWSASSLWIFPQTGLKASFLSRPAPPF